MSTKLNDYDYHLPDELIGQSPREPRDSSKLLLVNRVEKSIEHKKFNDSLINTGKLTYYLKPVFYKLDTLKYDVTFKSLEDYESTLFLIDTTGRKIDFSKIKIDNYKRVEKIPCRDKYLDNCNQYFVASFKLSEIIINKNKAYTEINFQCGGKCGKGIKYELKKINGIWKIIKEDLLWIS